MQDRVKEEQSMPEDIRMLLRQLPGVYAAGVKFMHGQVDEEIEEVHILSDTVRNPKQVVRDVQSALYAAYGIRIDHRIVSVAQMAMDVTQDVPDTPNALFMPRARYKGISYEEQDTNSIVRVKLEYSGMDYQGEASCPGAQAEQNRLRMIAEATLGAVCQLAQTPSLYALVAAQKVLIAGMPIIVTMVQCPEQGNLILTGAARCGEQEMQSVVRATLDAVNRHLSKRLI